MTTKPRDVRAGGLPPEPATLLRAAGLRVTRPRIAVIDQLRVAPHTTADDLAAAVRARLGKVSRQAIYDVLHALRSASIVRVIEPAGSPAHYELHAGDNHHHLVCRRCGALADVECALGAAPCLDPSQTHGYAVDEAEVVFWGLCPTCAECAEAQEPAASRPPAPDRATS